MALVAVGEKLLPSGHTYEQALAEARQLLWEPRRVARALQLCSKPCMLDEIIAAGAYLGLSPDLNPDLMFLVDVMLCPEMPVGWLKRSSAGAAPPYYWNSLTGQAQWEHPQVSILTGVANKLKKWPRYAVHFGHDTTADWDTVED